MNQNFLDFEQPIAELDAKIQELRHASQGSAFNIEEDIASLRAKLKSRTEEIFKALTPWQIAQLARHPQRPYTQDYIDAICEEFEELAGDRAFADDAALICGIGRIDGRPVTIIGHQKGLAIRKGATPNPRSSATSACRAPRAIARPCAS